MKQVINLEHLPNDSRLRIAKDDIVQTLNSRMGTGGGNVPMIMERNMDVVRRLTPTECSRLQGYPDGWVDIPETMVNGKLVKPSDSAKYKALGNSIALPQWWWLICKMNLPMGSKLGSLFDGIGGFPLVWETRYGKGTARWASEIEPFPIAVTMHRFPEEENDIMDGSIDR